jgi:hypothetical protein
VIRVLAGVVAAALLLTGCSEPVDVAAEAETPPSTVVTTEQGVPNPQPGGTVRHVVGDQRLRLDLPSTGTITGLAVWFHGQLGDVDGAMDEEWLNSLSADGWAVASADLHLANWGSPASVSDAVTLSEWAQAETGAPLKLLIGGSMGVLTSLNALIDGALWAHCWYGTMPVVDVTAVSGVAYADAQVEAVYGGPPPASSNPAARLDRLPISVRYFVVASPQDTWVPATAHADRLVAALRQSGADVSVAPAVGQHGDPSQMRPSDLREFAASCA